MADQKALLLNASNMESFPVFSYAFIQVPAVARQSGIEVICKDMLGIHQDMWEQTIQTLIEQHNPVMILITMRNTDSLNAQDYERDGSKDERVAYFPIEQTKELIAAIRAVSALKIAVGGFGFSVMPDELMRYLQPDFGVFGDPDGFFEHFDNILVGELAEVPNILYFQNGQLISNPPVLYPPLTNNEYTQQVIDDMLAFYDDFPSPGFQGAPIEIMRGCKYSCVFCSEPLVKGRQVRYHDLSAVMQDIEILVDHGVTKLYMVTSELNPEGNAFILELADKISTFNARQTEDRRVTWFGANYLLNFSQHDYEKLYQSGFTGGWFDITALDDENAGVMRTPYRNKDLLTHLKTHAIFTRKQATQTAENTASKGDITIGWTMFLGNPATTVKTIRNTLRIANQNGIAQLFDTCGIIVPLRVFDYEEPNEDTLDVTYSVNADLEKTGYQPILPSFAYPPALLQDFGSKEEISALFKHIAETYLSTKYKNSRYWHNFIKRNTNASTTASWMEELSERYGVHIPDPIRPTLKGKPSPLLIQLFSEKEPNDDEISTYEKLAKQIADSLLAACLEGFPDPLRLLGLPTSIDRLEQLTPYDFAAAVFKRWSTEKEIFDELAKQTQSILSEPLQGYIRFCVQVMLYKLNVIIRPQYRPFFV